MNYVANPTPCRISLVSGQPCSRLRWLSSSRMEHLKTYRTSYFLPVFKMKIVSLRTDEFILYKGGNFVCVCCEKEFRSRKCSIIFPYIDGRQEIFEVWRVVEDASTYCSIATSQPRLQRDGADVSMFGESSNSILLSLGYQLWYATS